MARAKQAAQRSKSVTKTAPKRKARTSGGSRVSRRITTPESSLDDDDEDDDDDNENVDDKVDDELPESYGASQESTAGLGEAKMALSALQAAMERAEKKDTFAKGFEKKVREDEKRLLDMLDEEQAKLQAESERFDSEFGDLLKATLKPFNTATDKDHNWADEEQECSDLPADTGLDSHPLYATCQAVLQGAHGLFDLFDQVNDCISSIKPLPNLTEQLESDYAEAQRLIETGREVTEEKIERRVTYDKKRESGGRGTRAKWRKRELEFERDENLKLMFELGKAEVGEGDSDDGSKGTSGWGVMAHKLQKGVKILASALSEENEGKKKKKRKYSF